MENKDINMSSYMCEIIEKVNETHDDFIFTTIEKFCGTNRELSK